MHIPNVKQFNQFLWVIECSLAHSPIHDIEKEKRGEEKRGKKRRGGLGEGRRPKKERE